MSVKDLQNTIFFNNPPEKIEMCLNCEREECTNCLSGYVPKSERKSRSVQLREIRNEVIACVKAGKSNKEIAALFDVRSNTVCHWKCRLKKEGLL